MKKVAIIILTYNCLEEATKLCIESIYAVNNEIPFEVVVVDNLSTDGTREYLLEFAKSHDNCKVILNDKNYGYAAGNNIGIKSIEADYYILLNNDTIVTDCWIDKFVDFSEKHPEVGMIGPVSNNVGNEQAISVKANERTGIITEGLEWARECYGDFFYLPMLGFFCVAIKKEVIDRVGLLDERYGIGMVEDDDYCLRVQQNGYQLACLEDVFIFHSGSISFKAMTVPQIQDMLIKNISAYEDKFNMPFEFKCSNKYFTAVLSHYLNALNEDNIDLIKKKIGNKLNVMNGYDMAELTLRHLRLQKDGAEKEQQSQGCQLKLEECLKQIEAINNKSETSSFFYKVLALFKSK